MASRLRRGGSLSTSSWCRAVRAGVGHGCEIDAELARALTRRWRCALPRFGR
jgi:hypothetical protein